MTTERTTAEPYSADETAAMLRYAAKANGWPAGEAAVEMLIRHDVWLRRTDFRRYVTVAVFGRKGELGADVDWRAVRTALDDPDSGDLTRGSGSAVRMLRLAISLAVGELAQLVTGLGSASLALVMRAIAHADDKTENVMVWVGAKPPGVLVRMAGRIVHDPADHKSWKVWDEPNVADPFDIHAVLFGPTGDGPVAP